MIGIKSSLALRPRGRWWSTKPLLQEGTKIKKSNKNNRLAGSKSWKTSEKFQIEKLRYRKRFSDKALPQKVNWEALLLLKFESARPRPITPQEYSNQELVPTLTLITFASNFNFE